MTKAVVALGDRKVRVGRLHFGADGRRQFSRFEYDEDWLRSSAAFALSPALPLQRGPFFSRAGDDRRDALSSVFQDAAPDSWGRRLLARRFGEGLTEFDCLVLADDRTRQGALRFLDESGDPLSPLDDPIPRRVALDDLRRLSQRYERDPGHAAEAVRVLAGAGGSLGGARPKATVIDEQGLWIAKFTALGDTRPVERAEVATLDLARAVGLRSAEADLALANTDFPVALIRRFDRAGGGRLAYMSARTALQRPGVEPATYVEIADFIRTHGVDAVADLAELWQRLVFTILVRNTDDHLKNHGFLYVRDNRWRLAPAFDINPQPGRQPQLETGISPEAGFTPSIAAAIEASRYFEIPATEARLRARHMATILADNWRGAFRRRGMAEADIVRFADAFDHHEMETARSL